MTNSPVSSVVKSPRLVWCIAPSSRHVGAAPVEPWSAEIHARNPGGLLDLAGHDAHYFTGATALAPRRLVFRTELAAWRAYDRLLRAELAVLQHRLATARYWLSTHT